MSPFTLSPRGSGAISGSALRTRLAPFSSPPRTPSVLSPTFRPSPPDLEGDRTPAFRSTPRWDCEAHPHNSLPPSSLFLFSSLTPRIPRTPPQVSVTRFKPCVHLRPQPLSLADQYDRSVSRPPVLVPPSPPPPMTPEPGTPPPKPTTSPTDLLTSLRRPAAPIEEFRVNAKHF